MNKKTNWNISGVILVVLVISLSFLMSYDISKKDDACLKYAIGETVIINEGEFNGSEAIVLQYGYTEDIIVYLKGFSTLSIPCEDVR